MRALARLWNWPPGSASACVPEYYREIRHDRCIRPLIAGNWKMNGLKASLTEFEAMLAGAAGVAAKADLLVCPPATLIAAFAEKAHG